MCVATARVCSRGPMCTRSPRCSRGPLCTRSPRCSPHYLKKISLDSSTPHLRTTMPKIPDWIGRGPRCSRGPPGAFYGQKAGVRRAVPYSAYVRVLSREGTFFIFQISSNNISFDAPCHGDAPGTLHFSIGAILGRKAGVRKPRNVPNVRTSTLEGRNFSIVQISSNNISFDAAAAGDVRDALCVGR
eukprot:COSAG01_NODE_2530_length_7495_cov_76.130206_6_plen_187_part_00